MRTTSIIKKLPFDTYRLVLKLERNGFSRKQAITIMQSINGMLSTKLDQLHQEMVNSGEAEKETFAYKEGLHDLKRELTTLRKTEAANLSTTISQLTRDVDMIAFKFREDFNNGKSDIQLEMNNRKADVKQDGQKNEMTLQECAHYWKISMGEIKTEMETMKLQLITKYATGIALGTTVGIVLLLKVVS